MSTFKITLELPVSVSTGLGDTSLKTIVPIKDYNEDVLKFALINGFIKAVNDVSRGVDDDGKVLTDEAWLAKREKRMTAWADGQWALRGAGERGDSNLRFLKEHYYYECLTERAMSASKVDKEMKETIKTTLGDDAKLTFDNFMLAIATSAVEDGDKDKIDAMYKDIEAELQKRADEAKAKREKAASKVDVSSILIRKK